MTATAIATTSARSSATVRAIAARSRPRDRGRDRDKGRDKRDREGGPSLRPYASSVAPRERDRAVDPNSPFAKLAALKEQLAGNRKE